VRIGYVNQTDAATITGTTAETGFALTRLQDDRLASKYRTTTVSSVIVTIDLGAYSTHLSMVAIVAHNLTTAATVVVDFNHANSWPGATSQTITTDVDMLVKFFTQPAEEYLTTETPDYLTTEDGDFLTTEYNYRWAQIQITDAANPEGYIEIGKIYLGTYITIDPSSLIDFKVSKRAGDRITRGRGRQKFAIPGSNWRRFELAFPESQYSMVSQIETMYEMVGNYKPVIFCNFDTIRDYVLVEPCYCSIDGDMGFQHSERMRFAYSLALEEDK
jgi:hypothetical protein